MPKREISDGTSSAMTVSVSSASGRGGGEFHSLYPVLVDQLQTALSGISGIMARQIKDVDIPKVHEAIKCFTRAIMDTEKIYQYSKIAPLKLMQKVTVFSNPDKLHAELVVVDNKLNPRTSLAQTSESVLFTDNIFKEEE